MGGGGLTVWVFCCFVYLGFLVGLLQLFKTKQHSTFPKASFTLFFQLLNRNTLESQTDLFIFSSLNKQPTQRTGTYLSKSCVTTGFPGILKQKMEQIELERQH